MECEGVEVGPDVTRICGVWRTSGDGRYVDDARGRVKRPEPSNTPSAGGNDSVDTARRASTFAAVG